ncbi:MAG: glycosyltransferase family 4 protein [Alphaproteobacteria bacterium]
MAGWPIPSRAANAVHVMKMCQAYASSEHDVTLIHPKADIDNLGEIKDIYSHYDVKNNFLIAPITRLKGRIGLIIFAIIASYKAKKEKADIIHSRCLMSAWFACYTGIPVIFEKHDSLENQGTITKAIFRSLLKKKNFSKLVVISDALKEHISTSFQIDSKDIISVHDGADPFPEHDAPVSFENDKGRLQVGYIGHLYPGRGIDIIGEIAKQLKQVDFHLVGGTTEDISHWKSELSELNNVYFHGYIPHKETIKYLKNVDILLAPYQKKVAGYKGKGNTVQWMSPLKIFEYMSTGTPMICSDLSVLHEILVHESNSFLCAPDKPNEWVDTIEYISDNYDEAKIVAQRAQREFLEHYTWKKRSEFIIKNLI